MLDIFGQTQNLKDFLLLVRQPQSTGFKFQFKVVKVEETSIFVSWFATHCQPTSRQFVVILMLGYS
uniref:Uncharacterized protein n=1 Tax=Setaria italica TaxID=4555 RepID=K3YKN6_SETIT